MELDRILLYSADEFCRYVAARLKYMSACYFSSKLQWSGGILRCLNEMDCYLLFPVVSVRLLIVSEHRWLTLLHSSQFVYTSILSPITESGYCANSRVLCKLKERAPSSTVEENLDFNHSLRLAPQCSYTLHVVTTDIYLHISGYSSARGIFCAYVFLVP